MKSLSDTTALVYDGGLFFELALRLARNGFKRVLYQCSIDGPFQKLNEAVIGDGFDTVERVLDFWPIKDEIDCFVFPDSSHPGLQLELVSQGKAVWGSREGCLLEWNRQQFVETLKSLGLSAPEYTPCHGLRALRKHLEPKTDQYVKISRWRGSFETFHWVDYRTSSGRLDELSVEFGGMQEDVTFLVFPNIEAVAELGYDGFNVRGQFPKLSVSGVEAKDKGYLGSIIAWDDLPDELRTINEVFRPILSKLGYANFWSAEGRKTEDDFFFTDPCPRHASPAGEGQIELYGNLPEIVWAGANGECIDPEPVAKHVAQAIIDHQGNEQHWRRIVIPDVVRPWVKLYNPVKIGEETYDLPPLVHSCDSIGSVLGIGDTPTEAVEALKENASALDGQPLTIHIESLVDAAIELEAAEKEGMTLTDEPMPEPARIVT